MSAQRKEEAAILFAQLKQVRENVSSLRELIESRGTGQEYVDSLRNTMDTVENDIFVVRQGHHAKFEALSAEEQQLNAAVAAVEAEINEWLSSSEETGKSRPATAGARPSTAASDAHQARSKIASMIQQPQLPPEVVAVDRILREEGGSTGGWDDVDHERFLRYRTQFKGQPHIYCAKTAEDLPDHDVASVERHEMWYVRYLKLLEEKKAAIRSWRSNKHSHAALDDSNEEGVAARSRPATATERGRGRQADTPEARAEQKAKLKEWKEEKARADAAEKQRKAEEEAARLEREREKIGREREDAKRRLSNYKHSKEAEEQRKKQEEEERLLLEREKGKMTLDQLERIRLRNKQMTEEHTNLVRRKAEQARIQAERIESLKREVPKPEASRDASRLTALTAASEAKRDARLRKDGEEPERPGYFAIMRPNVIHNPTRAVPSWRAGV
eukprot:Tamp_11091.p1 GENE.Tamp_11091~~Tamp_11091.p1  ORF type:complete len:511 (-),score=143.10 Tamp_11091:426-1760(-)